jgi:hypothetical protein
VAGAYSKSYAEVTLLAGLSGEVGAEIIGQKYWREVRGKGLEIAETRAT